MANTYTVKAGDNLSAIAKTYGVDAGAISGYKSGNPNMIYPGEVLSIGGASPAPAATPTYSANTSSPSAGTYNPNWKADFLARGVDVNGPEGKQMQALEASQGGGTGTARSNFVEGLYKQGQEQDAKKAAASAEAVKKLQEYYANLEDPTARLNRLRDENGVTQQQSLVDGLTKNVLQSQDTIFNLEPDINNRIGDFFVNETGRTSLLARELDPLQKNLSRLLNQKQTEEVGLAGKQQFISELLNLSFKNDEMQAKPLQLGVDYTEKDRDVARQIFEAYASKATTAFNADESYKEDLIKLQKQQDFSASQAKESFANSITLENLKTANSNASKAATSSKDNKAQKTTDLFNSILGNSKTEYDVWKQIYTNRNAYANAGIDVDKLWSMHAALKAKTGQGGGVRAGATGDDLLNSALFQ